MQEYGAASNLTAVLAGPFAGAGQSCKVARVQLPAEGWKNARSPYFQTVEPEGLSENSMVLLQPDREQIEWLCRTGTAIHIDNEAGVATAYAVGTRPREDLDMQITLLEVTAL